MCGDCVRAGNKAMRTAETPTVFFSGTLHGNERVGPTATTEFATWLLEMYRRDSWAKLLLDTRDIIIVPAANALGYARNTREEGNVDPNRDFAWDQVQSNPTRDTRHQTPRPGSSEAGRHATAALPKSHATAALPISQPATVPRVHAAMRGVGTLAWR